MTENELSSAEHAEEQNLTAEKVNSHVEHRKYILMIFLLCVVTVAVLAYILYILEHKESQRADELNLNIKSAMGDLFASVRSSDIKTSDMMSAVMSRIDAQQTSISDLNASMLRMSSEDMAMMSAVKSMDAEFTAQRALIEELRSEINGRAGKSSSEEAVSSLSYARSAKDRDRNLSELYYTKAITLAPNDTSVISEYVDFVLGGVRDADDIISVRDKLARTSTVVQTAIVNADADKVNTIRKELDKINDRFQKWESANRPKGLDLAKLSSELKSIDANDINKLRENEKQLLEIAESMGRHPSQSSEYKNLSASVRDKIERLQNNIAYKKMIDNAERLLSDASRESDDTYRGMLIQSAMGQIGNLISMRGEVSSSFSSKLKELIRKVDTENKRLMEKLRKSISSRREDIRRKAHDPSSRVGRYTAQIRAVQMFSAEIGPLCSDILLPQFRDIFAEKRLDECKKDMIAAQREQLAAYNSWAGKTVRKAWYDFKSRSNYTAHMRYEEYKDKGRAEVSGTGKVATAGAVGLGSLLAAGAGFITGPAGWIALGVGAISASYLGSKASDKVAESVYKDKYDPAWENRATHARNVLKYDEFAKIDARYLNDSQVSGIYSETFHTIWAVAGSSGGSSLWNEIQRASAKRPLEDF